MAQPNGLNPNVDRIGFRASSAVITGGVGYDDTTIKADVGTLSAPSIYIGSNSSTPGLWVMVGTTWTSLTIN